MAGHIGAVWDKWAWLGAIWAASLPFVVGYVLIAYRHRLSRSTNSLEAIRDSTFEGLTALALLPALLLLLTPGGQSSGSLRLVPLRGFVELSGASDSDFILQIAGNVILFAPFGALIPLRWPLRMLDVALAVGALSIAIETLQRVALHRVASIDDVLLNTIGAILGAMCTRKWWSIRRATRAARFGTNPRRQAGE